MNEEKVSEKCMIFLKKKLNEIELKIKKLKRKRKLIKILYTTSIISSISLSCIIASLTTMIAVPIIVVTSLSTGSAILTGISAKFNLINKKIEINRLIEKLNKIQVKIEYVVNTNGDLTKEEYNKIVMEFV